MDVPDWAKDPVSTPATTASGDVPDWAKAPEPATASASAVPDWAQDPLPAAVRYPLEATKGLVEGAKIFPAQAMEGYSVAGAGFDKKQLQFMDMVDQGYRPKASRDQNMLAIDPYGYLDMTGEQRDQFRQQHQAEMQTPVAQRPLYRAGKAVEGFGSEYTAPGPGFEGKHVLTRDIPSAFGSMGAGIGAAYIPYVGPVLAPAMYVGAGMGQQYDDAIKSGATEDQALRANAIGSVAGATDLADVLIPQLGGTGRALGLIKRVGLRVLEGSLIEGGQEGLQQFIQNAIAKGLYDPNRDLMDEVPYNAFIGMIAGGAGSAVLGGHGHEQGAAPSNEDINSANAPLNAPTDVSGRLRTAPAQTQQGPLGPTPPPAVPPAGGGGVPTSVPNVDPFGLTMDPGAAAQMSDHGIFLHPDEVQGIPPTPRGPEPAPFVPQPAATVEQLQASGDMVPADTVTRLQDMAKSVNPTKTNQVPDWAQELQPTETAQSPTQTAARETIDATPGMNIRQVSNVLSSSLYGDPTIATPITVKEMVQNAFDGIKTSMEKSGLKNGNINVVMDTKNRRVTITDNGSGMLPTTLAGPFLTVGGTLKENSRPSGGLGIAKMMIIFMNKRIRVTTMRDGKVAELNSTGPELQAALEAKGAGPKIPITVRTATASDHRLFPDGHGTQVSVEIPQTFHDPSTGEVKEIPFYSFAMAHPVLQNSPLFAPIDVTVNGANLPIGNGFPSGEYQQFRNVNFGWGTARIYVSTSPSQTSDSYQPNVHVLSNGLWQFSAEIKKDPRKTYGPNIPVNIYLDLDPKVAAGQPGYPFAPNRQDFSPAVKKDFGKLFTYLSLVHQQADLEKLADNFGSMQFMSSDGRTITSTPPKIIQPSRTKTKGARSTILDPTRIADATWSFKDGNLIVDGREVPDLTPQELEKYQVDTSELRIPQLEVDAHSVFVHDNTDVTIDPLTGPQSIVSYGRQRFGHRFDEYLFFIGSAFRELRDNIVRFMPKEVSQPKAGFAGQIADMKNTLSGQPTSTTPVNGYEGLSEWGVGVSMDPEYRGVSVTLPVNAMFVNPLLPRYLDPIRGGFYMTTTMVHEAAHYKVRSHDDEAGFPQEFQDLWTNAATQIWNNLGDASGGGFNFNAWQQKVIDIFARYNDVLTHMNGVMTSGNFDISTRGSRFKGGTLEASDGGSPQQSGGQRNGPGGNSGLHSWAQAGATTIAEQSGRTDYAFETATPGIGHNGRPQLPADGGLGANQRATNTESPGTTAVEQQPETQSIRSLSAAATGGSPAPGVTAGFAHADKMNRFYKWMAGLDQLVQRNPRFLPLLRYYEAIIGMHNEETNIQDAAVRVMKDWRKIGKESSEKLVALIDDVSNMRYRTQQEVRQGVKRQPTNVEFQNLVRKHGVDAKTLAVYNKIRMMFDGFLGTVQRNSNAAAARAIQDPVLLAAKIDEIRATVDELRQTPYFPFMNFGKYFVSATNVAGDTLHFETFERHGLKSAQRLQAAKANELRGQPGVANVRVGVVPEAATPFMGMPANLLAEIKADPSIALTPAQKDALDFLTYMRSSQTGFASRFKTKQYIPGYSFDFQRAFAKYFFHGARYAARQQYLGALKDQIAAARAVNGNRPGAIANYMDDHLTNTVLDSTGDYGWAKGAVTLWALGYVPATAFQNATQTPLITFPFLSGKFGEHRAIPAMLRAAALPSTYYKRGRYDQATEFENRAFGYGIRTGRISETQAPELAGMAQGMNMLLGYGGNRAQRGWAAFMEKSMWHFEMMEQMNRRIAFRASLQLAMSHPTAKFVQESVHLHEDEYNKLIAGTPLGRFTPAEAAAIVTAANATDQTQFVYARYARPRLFRGKKGILLVFKKYMQSTLFMLGNNKSDVLPRYLLVVTALGGLGGLPYYDDLKGILQALGYWLFGKNYNLDREMKEFVNQFSNGTIDPDLVLHGLARKGFGLPAVLDLMGKNKGRGLQSMPAQNVPFPVLDRSRAIGMGNVMPIDFGKTFVPTNDVKDQIAEQTQQASGAVFSVGFNLYKALMDQKNDWTDFKRWERAMPHALSNTSRAWRAFNEGRERGPGGVNSAPTVINYDVRDTEQMMEALALLGGYTPLRLQMKWDSSLAKAEVEKFYDLQRSGLAEQFFEATQSTNPGEKGSVIESIRKFNRELPTWAQGRQITMDFLDKSIQQRFEAKMKREAGIPRTEQNVGIERHIDELYPQFGGQGMIDVRRVR